MINLDLAEAFPSDFTLQYPPRREYFMENFRDSVAERMIEGFRGLMFPNMYFHVPFCAQKCSYCNFAVVTKNSDDLYASYIDTLLLNVENFLKGSSVVGVSGLDIGGGTPTIVPVRFWEKFFAGLSGLLRVPRSSVSIETTPKIAADSGVLDFFAAYCHRVSMGVQSTEASMLLDLGRAEQIAVLDKALLNMRSAGFDRTNLDLIFGLPGQTMASWCDDVRMAADSGVDGVSLYDCLYRGKGRRMTRKPIFAPTPEMYGEMYDAGYSILSGAGYCAPYGSVTFGKFGETGASPYFENRLMHGEGFVGFGNYATSLLGNDWLFAPGQVSRWMEAIRGGDVLPEGFGYSLPVGEVVAKHALLSLSFGRLNFADFAKYGQPLEVLFPALSVGVDKGWLVQDSLGYGIGPGCFRFMPMIRSLFYTEQAIGWLNGLRESIVM